MRRRLGTTLLFGVTCFIPVLALRAQQAAPSTRPSQPASSTAKKAEPPRTATATAKATAKASDPIDRIKEEGLRRSQVMATLSYLTDVVGPRLTGSPNLKRANEWTRDRLIAWGLVNARLEPWGPFGRGWSLKRFSAQVIEPQCIPMIAYPKAWSPGTDGTLDARVVYFDANTEADFARFKGKLKGAIVLTAPAREVAAHFQPLATRMTDSALLAMANAAEPMARGSDRRAAQAPAQAAAESTGGPGRRADRAGNRTGAGAGNDQPAAAEPPRPGRFAMTPEIRTRMELARKKSQFLAEEGAALLVDPSPRGDGGTLFVQAASVPGASPFPMPGQAGGRRVSPWDKDAPRITPQIVMAQEHYNRLVRMIQQGERPRMVVDLSVEFHDDDPMAYNTVAEIPGTDLKDEIVMLGGHMDSWHGGTGATDNGAGVSVAMEAVRILQALELQPRRTIRIALWSGEEQGLLGSRAFVTHHYGRSPASLFGPPTAAPPTTSSRNGDTARSGAGTHVAAPKPEYGKFSAYFNLDNGTGKVRGVYLQGNEAVRPIFRRWLQPFREMGASTLTITNTGGTDHLSFDGIGLPGFQFIQDEVEYESRTHHSNQDVFDRIQAEDMKQAAVIMAAFVYNAATMDEKLPRKPVPASSSASAPAVRAAVR